MSILYSFVRAFNALKTALFYNETEEEDELDDRQSGYLYIEDENQTEFSILHDGNMIPEKDPSIVSGKVDASMVPEKDPNMTLERIWDYPKRSPSIFVDESEVSSETILAKTDLKSRAIKHDLESMLRFASESNEQPKLEDKFVWRDKVCNHGIKNIQGHRNNKYSLDIVHVLLNLFSFNFTEFDWKLRSLMASFTIN